MPDINLGNYEIGEGDLTLQYQGEPTATDVGGCIGASLDIDIKDLDIEVGQFQDPIENFEIGRVITFSVTLKEDTLRNFVSAIGGDPADIVDEIDKQTYALPGNSVNSSKFAELVYTVPLVRNKLKIKKITLWKVKAKKGIKYSFNRNKEIQYTITLTAYADTAAHEGSPGEFMKEKY